MIGCGCCPLTPFPLVRSIVWGAQLGLQTMLVHRIIHHMQWSEVRLRKIFRGTIWYPADSEKDFFVRPK
jgi:hypothetical protein